MFDFIFANWFFAVPVVIGSIAFWVLVGMLIVAIVMKDL